MSIEITNITSFVRFTDSPYGGDPACICSRCSEKIGADEHPLRCWPTKDELTAEEIAAAPGGYEYRFCDSCIPKLNFVNTYGMGIDDD
jgi:hypothetical protein